MWRDAVTNIVTFFLLMMVCALSMTSSSTLTDPAEAWPPEGGGGVPPLLGANCVPWPPPNVGASGPMGSAEPLGNSSFTSVTAFGILLLREVENSSERHVQLAG